MAQRAAAAARRAPARPARRPARTGAQRRPARRRSGPAAGPARALPIRIAQAPAARAARVRGVAVLDGLLHGRGWIGLVGVLLAGIVFFNVDLLQMNRDIARTAERAAETKRQNARLRVELARLASTERIQEAAGERGLVLPPAGQVRYLRAIPSLDARRAARRTVPPGEHAGQPAQSPQPQGQVQQTPTPVQQAPAPVQQPPPQPAPVQQTTPTPPTAQPAPVTQAPPGAAPQATAPGAQG